MIMASVAIRAKRLSAMTGKVGRQLVSCWGWGQMAIMSVMATKRKTTPMSAAARPVIKDPASGKSVGFRQMKPNLVIQSNCVITNICMYFVLNSGKIIR